MNLTLNPQSGLPLYRQLKDALKERIQNGDPPPDQPLPTERELQESLGIARATVRQAMLELEREGWLVRQRGRGTFVSPAHPAVKVGQPLHRLSGFSENMRSLGLTPSSTLVSAVLEAPRPDVATALRLGAGSVVAVLTRVRLADREPLMLERCHLDYALVPNLLEQPLEGSLYELLVQTYRLALSGGEEVLEAALADREVRQHLQLPKNAAVLYTQRHVATVSGQPVEYTQRYARADKCSFWVSLQGDNARVTLKGEAHKEMVR